MISCSVRRRGTLLLLFTIALILFVPSKLSLVVQDKSGRDVSILPVENTSYFEVSFRHSVNKGIIIERYEINLENKTFYLKTGWFQSYGAGMMDSVAEGVQMTEEGDFLRLDFPKNELHQVSYAAAGIANHKLSIGNNEVFLFQKNPYKTSIISLKRTNLFQRICTSFY